jgi:hypothetical protein
LERAQRKDEFMATIVGIRAKAIRAKATREAIKEVRREIEEGALLAGAEATSAGAEATVGGSTAPLTPSRVAASFERDGLHWLAEAAAKRQREGGKGAGPLVGEGRPRDAARAVGPATVAEPVDPRAAARAEPSAPPSNSPGREPATLPSTNHLYHPKPLLATEPVVEQGFAAVSYENIAWSTPTIEQRKRESENVKWVRVWALLPTLTGERGEEGEAEPREVSVGPPRVLDDSIDEGREKARWRKMWETVERMQESPGKGF